jgi:hypothetical protein
LRPEELHVPAGNSRLRKAQRRGDGESEPDHGDALHANANDAAVWRSRVKVS